MIRTQISFDEEQFAELQRRAQAEGVSMAAYVRAAVDECLAAHRAERQRIIRRALSAVGKLHGGGAALGQEHDRYLDEAYRDW